MPLPVGGDSVVVEVVVGGSGWDCELEVAF